MFVVSSFVAFVRLEVSFPESAFEGLLSRLNPFFLDAHIGVCSCVSDLTL